MPRCRLILITAIALGCGRPEPVRPRAATYLAKIKIEGNKAIDDDDLVPGLALDRVRRGGRGVDAYQLSLDIDRIRAEYLRHGFFGVKVTAKVDGPADNQTGKQTVVFTVVEGQRARVRVEIVGLPPELSLEDARAAIPIADNAPFDYLIYDEAKQSLLLFVEEGGYAHVELDASVTEDPATGIATARYALLPGPLCRFGPVKIEGATGELRTAIVRRLEAKSGERYSPSKLAATQVAIYELGRFAAVRITPERTGTNVIIPIQISVTRGSRGELKLGGGAGYDPVAPEVRMRASISHIPRILPLWTFGIDSRAALVFRERTEETKFEYDPQVRIIFSGQRLDLFRPRLIGDIGFGLDYFTVEAYTSTGPFVQLGLTRPIGRWLRVRAGWSLTYLTFDEISVLLDDPLQMALGLDRSRRLGAYQQTVVADLRDNPADPRRGAYFSLRLAEGTRYAGGEYEFVQPTFDARGYFPLGSFVLAVRARIGAIFGDIPITERYFAGGAQSQRGFAYRQLAPSVVGEIEGKRAAVVFGGSAALETSAELRATIGTVSQIPIIGSVFFDGADVVPVNDQLGKTMLHFAAGVGIGVNVDGIKVRLDIGHRLNRTGPAEPSYRPDAWLPNSAFHIGIGDAF